MPITAGTHSFKKRHTIHSIQSNKLYKLKAEPASSKPLNTQIQPKKHSTNDAQKSSCCWVMLFSCSDCVVILPYCARVSTIFIRSERVIHNFTLHLISIAWMSVCVWVTWCRPPLCLGRVWRGNWFHGYICQSGCSTCSTAFAAASDERGEWWQDSAGLHGWIYETHTNHSK